VRPVLAGPAARAGLQRARDTAGPITWTALACGTAYALAAWLLSNPYPFFAAVAAFAALGFSPDVRPRRVGEVAFGVTMGVGLGELFQTWVGSGAWQVAVVVIVGTLVARVLDPSPVLTTQSAVQAIVVLGLPAAATTAGPVGRWLDALLGGAVALVFSLFIPKDPRRRPQLLTRDVVTSIASILGLVALALRTGEPSHAQTALVRGRSLQPALTALEDAVAASASTARLSPAWRRFRADLDELADAAEHADRAVRSSRVLARRVATAGGVRDEEIAQRCEALEAGASRLAGAFGGRRDPAAARALLEQTAATLVITGERDPMRHTLTSLLRSVAFDLLLAAGASEAEATRALQR